jgi:Uncharacterized protein conserved in bacteria (DUF2059)
MCTPAGRAVRPRLSDTRSLASASLREPGGPGQDRAHQAGDRGDASGGSGGARLGDRSASTAGQQFADPRRLLGPLCGARADSSRRVRGAPGATYDQRFSPAELRDLLAFYQSPLGLRLLDVQPDLTRDAMLAGQQWGMRIGAKIGQELAAEGIQIQP